MLSQQKLNSVMHQWSEYLILNCLQLCTNIFLETSKGCAQKTSHKNLLNSLFISKKAGFSRIRWKSSSDENKHTQFECLCHIKLQDSKEIHAYKNERKFVLSFVPIMNASNLSFSTKIYINKHKKLAKAKFILFIQCFNWD